MNNANCCTPARRESAEVHPLGRLMDDWFGYGRLPTVFGGAEVDRLLKPALDVAETEHSYVVRAELPGVNKEDVTITIEDGVLTIAGEKKREEEHKDQSWHRVERSYGSFQRTLSLPKGVDGDKAEAAYKDGILTVELPKHDQAKPKTLKVK